MKPYIAMLRRRYQRLCRLIAYGQDGHGNQLSDQAFTMICLCITSTALDIARMEVEA